MELRSVAIFLILSFVSNTFGNDDFLQIPPIKMLNVRSVASRYPAANSTYRTNVENGYVSSTIKFLTHHHLITLWHFFQDEEVDRTQSDTLNGFPAMKLTLQPGGCANYEFPVKPGQNNTYIQPAKKEGEFYWVLHSFTVTFTFSKQ